MKKTVTPKTQRYNKSTVINPDGFFGWQAINTGTENAEVGGVLLTPGVCIDFTHLNHELTWNSPITMIASDNAVVYMTRLYYAEQ